MKAWTLLLVLFVLCGAGARAASPRQEAAGEVEVVNFGWNRERIRQRPSMVPLVSPEELVRQSRREAQLSAARNSANKGAEAAIETQINNHEAAKSKASQTAPPTDGYRYTVKLRNNGAKTIKSIDWDYVFSDPTDKREVAHHQFTSDETIKPGKAKEFSVLYLVPPVKTVSVKQLGKKNPLPFEERVVLVRIQFSDGSVWQRP